MLSGLVAASEDDQQRKEGKLPEQVVTITVLVASFSNFYAVSRTCNVNLQDFQIRLDSFRNNLQMNEETPAVEQVSQTTPPGPASSKPGRGIDAFEKRSMERCQELFGNSLKELRSHYNIQMRVNLAELEALYDGKVKNLQGALEQSTGLGNFAFDLVRGAKTTIDEKNDRIKELEGIVSEQHVTIATLNVRIHQLKDLLNAEVAKTVPEDIYRAWEANRQKGGPVQEKEKEINSAVVAGADPVPVAGPTLDPVLVEGSDPVSVSVPVYDPISAPVSPRSTGETLTAAIAEECNNDVTIELPGETVVMPSVDLIDLVSESGSAPVLPPVSVPSTSVEETSAVPMEEERNNNDTIGVPDQNIPNVLIPTALLEEMVGVKRKISQVEEETNGTEKYDFHLEVCPVGKFIKVINRGGTEVQIRGWLLVHSSADCQTKYKFSRNTNLKPFTEVIVWSMDCREPDRMLISNHFLREKKWIIADSMKTELFDANRELVASSVRGELGQ